MCIFLRFKYPSITTHQFHFFQIPILDIPPKNFPILSHPHDTQLLHHPTLGYGVNVLLRTIRLLIFLCFCACVCVCVQFGVCVFYHFISCFIRCVLRRGLCQAHHVCVYSRGMSHFIAFYLNFLSVEVGAD